MKKTNLLLGLFSLVLVFCVVSCGKKDQKAKTDSRFTTKQVEITEEKPEYLLNDMSISGFRVNDTINGIKVNLLCPVVKSKINLRIINLFPINISLMRRHIDTGYRITIIIYLYSGTSVVFTIIIYAIRINEIANRQKQKANDRPNNKLPSFLSPFSAICH